MFRTEILRNLTPWGKSLIQLDIHLLQMILIT